MPDRSTIVTCTTGCPGSTVSPLNSKNPRLEKIPQSIPHNASEVRHDPDFKLHQMASPIVGSRAQTSGPESGQKTPQYQETSDPQLHLSLANLHYSSRSPPAYKLQSVIHEWRVLYSARVRQKDRRWCDGTLQYFELNRKIQILSDERMLMASDFYPASLPHPRFADGTEWVLPGGHMVVEFGEQVASAVREVKREVPRAGHRRHVTRPARVGMARSRTAKPGSLGSMPPWRVPPRSHRLCVRLANEQRGRHVTAGITQPQSNK